MSALKQNPFLVGFGAVMVVGVGALGYLTYSAAEAHSAARAEYDNAAQDLTRLQNLRPYPIEENLAKFIEQKNDLQAKVTKLQQELSGSKIKVEDISPSGFQTKLRDAVASVETRAKEANVTLPVDDKGKFYLGFNTYQGEPPQGPAAPHLYRELRAIESIFNLIIETKNVAIKELKREPLKEEQAPKAPAPDPKKGGKKGPTTEDDSKKVVHKESFAIKFSTTPENFQRILSGIVNNKEQFFIPRHITVLNEKPEALSKAVAATPPPPPPPDPNQPAATPAAAAAPAGPTLEYVFGKELVEVNLVLDLVDVAEPEAPAAGKADKQANRNK